MTNFVSAPVTGPYILENQNTDNSNSFEIQAGGSVTSTGAGIDAIDGDTSADWQITVDSLGTVSSTAGFGIFLAGQGTITNSGMISGLGGVVVEDQGSNDSVTNTAQGTITATGLYNSGANPLKTISAIYVAAPSGGAISVNNAGHATAAQGYGIGLGATGTVTNSGTVTGGEDGVVVTSGVGDIENSGSIAATIDDGVGLFGGGTVTNDAGGSISGIVGTRAAGVFITGASGTLTNSGKILGLFYGALLTAGGGITNNASATISAQNEGVEFTNVSGTVSNSGLIQATETGVGAAGADLEMGGSITNNAGGTISGAGYGVFVAGAAGTLTNAGTIIGLNGTAVNFTASSSANRLIVDPGAVFKGSVVNNGGGVSVLELASGAVAGSISGIGGASFSGFQTLDVDTSADWTLNGANSIANVTDNGTLVIAGSLDVTTAIDPASTGVFDLGAGGTLDVAQATGSQAAINFQGASELLIDQAASFGPLLENFGAKDSIDIKSFSGGIQNYDSSTGLLTLSNGATLDFDTSTLGSGTPQAVSDGSGGILITLSNTPVITLGGFTNGAILDTQTIAPFSAVTVSDSISGDQVSATIAFAAANGTLSGQGLSPGVVSNGTVTYSLSATNPGALQTELRALTFTPTAHQGAAGTTVTTAFDLTVSDGVPSNTVSNDSTDVVVTETAAVTFVSVATFLSEQSSLDALPGGFSISDTAFHVANALDQLNADTHINSIVLTDSGTPTLTLSIEEALNDTHALSIMSPHTTALADTAADIELISSTQASTLQADGYMSIAATGSVAMTIAEATYLSYGDGFDGIRVTGAPVVVSGTVAAMAAIPMSEAATFVDDGYTLTVRDTAANIRAMTATQIAALVARHVTQINASDTSVALTVAKAEAFESAGFKLSAPPGDRVLIYDTAAQLEALTASQIAGLPAIGVTLLDSDNANVSYSPAQTAAIISSGLQLFAVGSFTVTENFANGSYKVYRSGQLIQQKSVNPDGSYDIAYFNAGRQTSEAIYNSAKAYVATAEDNVNGSGNLLVYASGVTTTTSAGKESITVGSDTFALIPHTFETTAIENSRSNETFVYGFQFGHDTIAGFLAATANHDHLQFSHSMFGFSPRSSQTADALALLNHFARGTTNTTITDFHGDTLTLNGVTIATLKAHLGDFKFT